MERLYEVGVERRNALRVKLKKPIKAKVRTYAPATVLDISTTGLLMSAEHPLPPRSGCDLKITQEETVVTLRGSVKRSWLHGLEENDRGLRSPIYRIAMQFDEPVPDLLERLNITFPLAAEIGVQPPPEEASEPSPPAES